MNGWRVVVSAARSNIHPSRSQQRHSLVPLLPGLTNEAAATRTYLLTLRSALQGVPGIIRKKVSLEVERAAQESSSRFRVGCASEERRHPL